MLEQSYTRRARRHGVDLPCDIVATHWEHARSHHATDMSAHGLWVNTSFPLPRGEEVVVTFPLPSLETGPRAWQTRNLTVFAQVVRSLGSRHARPERGERGSRGGMGLRFVNLAVPERRALQRCLSEMAEATDPWNRLLRWCAAARGVAKD